jgi:hypothetical protein
MNCCDGVRLCLCGSGQQTGPLSISQIILTGESRRTLSQCHFIHHESHVDWPGRQPGPSRWEASDWPPEIWHGRWMDLVEEWKYGMGCPAHSAMDDFQLMFHRNVASAVNRFNWLAFMFQEYSWDRFPFVRHLGVKYKECWKISVWARV